jgi:ribonuclease BN (tRNA processing enzyme)
MNPRLTILGSSSGKASKTRAGSSYLIDLGERGVLFDCGDGATRHFLSMGYKPEWVTDIFISHTHADHVGGLPYFVLQHYLSRSDTPLTIHASEEAIAYLKLCFEYCYLYSERFDYEVLYAPLRKSEPWQGDGIRVTPYRTTHLDILRAYAAEHSLRHGGDCYALRIEVGGRTLVYSADLGSLDDLKTIPGAVDMLLVETTHVDLDGLWSWAEERGIGKIILTHIGDDFNPEVTVIASKYTSAEIHLAADCQIYDIG